MTEPFTIASLLPRAAAVAEIAGDDPCDLLPEEKAILGHVGEKRRRDFSCGRECARRAMQKLGFAPVPVLTGPSRQPLWPAGICGSITHATGYCAAALALTSEISSLGIDAERRRTLPDGVLERVSNDQERAWIRAADPHLPWGVLLFSAKESVYKTWFPLLSTWLGFRDVHVRFDPAAGSFRASILTDLAGAPRLIEGRFHADATHVYTTAVIPASPR